MVTAANYAAVNRLLLAERVRAGALASRAELPLNKDAWDGYPAARARLYEAWRLGMLPAPQATIEHHQAVEATLEAAPAWCVVRGASIRAFMAANTLREALVARNLGRLWSIVPAILSSMAQPLRRYLCNACGVSGMSDVVPGPFRVAAPQGTPTWKRACPSCGAEIVDLSYAMARDHVEHEWEQDKKRRDKLAVIISAPVALLGLVLGIVSSIVLTAGTNRIGVFNILIPLLVAGGLFTLSTRILENMLPAKARDPDMSLGEIERLEQIRRAEDQG